MNLVKTAPAFVKVMYLIHAYNKATMKKADELRAAEDYEGERELLIKNTGIYIKKIADVLGVDFEVLGEENIPDEGPFMIYANHQGFADILTIFAVVRKVQIGFIAKEEFKKWGPVANGIRYTRSIFLKRGDKRAAIETIKEASDYLHNGFNLCIFPEGTRARGPVPGEFKPGAFKFAQKAKVPVLPVTLYNSYEMFEVDNSFHPCTIKVEFHPMVHIESMDRKEQTAAWDQIVETICAPLGSR